MHTSARLLRAIVVFGVVLVAPACERGGCPSNSNSCPIDAPPPIDADDATDASPANASER